MIQYVSRVGQSLSLCFGIDICLSSHEFVPVKELVLEKDLYRALTKLKYQDPDSSFSGLINDMLKEYLHTYVLSKRMGHMLVTRDLVKTSINTLDEDELKHVARENAVRYTEAAIIEHGKPSLAAYLELIRAFAKANRFEYEFTTEPAKQSKVIIVQFRMGRKFTLYKAETYRILLQQFAEVERVEATDTTLYIEYSPKEIVETRIADQSKGSG